MQNDIDARFAGFMSSAEVAEKLGVTPKTLTNWARKGIGPKRYNFSSRLSRYKVDDVLEWIESNAA